MSTLQVENLIGPTSGSNANKVIIPSGQTLDASNGFVAPSGSVIQVVQGETNTSMYSDTDNTPLDTGLQATITPKFSNSKILVTCDVSIGISSGFSYLDLYLYRQGSNVKKLENSLFWANTSNPHFGRVPLTLLDNPSSSSSLVYKIYVQKNGQASGQVKFNPDSGVSTITLMEIAQ